MNFYIIGIIVFSIVFIACIFLLIYYIKDEKNLKEVSDNDLIRLGKTYSKQEFEDQMFYQYSNILTSTQDYNYNFLKDVVADEIYNQILLSVKKSQERNEKNFVENISKEFSKLIWFEIIDDLEVAKLWVRYSSCEYITAVRKVMVDDHEEEQEIVVAGDIDRPIFHEHILTFVKNKTSTENITCPSCGYQTHILKTSKCTRCENEIVSKKEHWVLVDNVTTNISKQK